MSAAYILQRSKDVIRRRRHNSSFEVLHQLELCSDALGLSLQREKIYRRALREISRPNNCCETPGCACIGGEEADCDAGDAKIALKEARRLQ